MRARHTAHSLPSFPVYASAFVDENLLVLGGGGGPSKTGIKNKLVGVLFTLPESLGSSAFPQRLYNVDESMTLSLVDELELEKGEDAPMSMAAHLEVRRVTFLWNASCPQLNSCNTEQYVRMWHKQLVRQGSERTERELPDVHSDERENVCTWVFFCPQAQSPASDRLTLIGTQGTLNSGDVDDYQVSRSPPLLFITSNTSAESDRSLARRHSCTYRRKTNCIADFLRGPNRDLLQLCLRSSHSLPIRLSCPLRAQSPSRKMRYLMPPSPLPQSVSLFFFWSINLTLCILQLIIATTKRLRVYSLPKSADSYASTLPPNNKKGKQKARPLEDLQLLKILDPPTQIGGKAGSTFRAARFFLHLDLSWWTYISIGYWTGFIPEMKRSCTLA